MRENDSRDLPETSVRSARSGVFGTLCHTVTCITF